MSNIIETALSSLKDSPIDTNLLHSIATKLTQRNNAIEELLAAKESGDLSQAEFENELVREQEVIEAELLTEQIAAKSEVQKAINTAFQTIEEGLL